MICIEIDSAELISIEWQWEKQREIFMFLERSNSKLFRLCAVCIIQSVYIGLTISNK